MNIILWFMRRRLKKELNEAKQGNVNIQSVNELKKKIRLITITMITLISLIVFILFITLSNFEVYAINMMSTAGNTILTLLEEKVEDEEEAKRNPNWSWTVKDDKPNNNKVPGNGGLYPKDHQLRLRAEFLEILSKSAKDASDSKNVFELDPAYVLGQMARETNNMTFQLFNTLNISSLYTDLLVHNPACLKDISGDVCLYNANGQSHYHGGTYSNGDQGDPYTQVAETSQSIYNAYRGQYGHAMSPFQFENPFIYSNTAEFFRKYGEPGGVTTSNNADKAQSEVETDSTLGFIRPNIAFVPDQVYNATFSFAGLPQNTSGANKRAYEAYYASAEFNSLSKKNQGAIRVILNTQAYAKGHMDDYDVNYAKMVMNLALNGTVTDIDRMADSVADKFWDSDTMQWKGSYGLFRSHIADTYGIELGGIQVYGLYSVCVGRIAWDSMQSKIDAAEKEGVASEENTPSNAFRGWLESEKMLGLPYVFAGNGEPFGNNGGKFTYSWDLLSDNGLNPNDYVGLMSFDCSSFAQYIYAHYYNKSISRSTFTQVKEGTEVAATEESLKEGDLVFFGGKASPTHVGIYLGDGEFVEAPSSGKLTRISKLSSRKVSTARRLL